MVCLARVHLALVSEISKRFRMWVQCTFVRGLIRGLLCKSAGQWADVLEGGRIERETHGTARIRHTSATVHLHLKQTSRIDAGESVLRCDVLEVGNLI